MRAAPAILVCTCLASLPACTAAQEQRPEPVFGVPDRNDLPHTAGIYFDCEAAAGLANHESLAIGETGSSHGSFYIAETRHHEKWAPAADVAVVGQNGRVTLLVVIDLRRSQLRPTVSSVDRTGAAPRLVQTLLPRSTAGVYFEIAWEPLLVRVRLERAAPWLDVPIAFKPEHLELGCSTGNAVFNGVTFDHPSEPAATTIEGPRPKD